MADTIHIFWPGDYRTAPNLAAQPQLEQVHAQLERALERLGRAHRRVEGFISRPHEAIERLAAICWSMRISSFSPARSGFRATPVRLT